MKLNVKFRNPLLTGAIIMLVGGGLLTYGVASSQPAYAEGTSNCEKLGWFPMDFGLKDHHVFWYGGYYYLVSIYVPEGEINPFLQNQFAYARTEDFCIWEDLTPILPSGAFGTWEAIWAPYVYEENSIYYLYYTGVTKESTQMIALATSDDPSDPNSWILQDKMIFRPDHSGMIWEDGQPADCRDPTVIKMETAYYLYYAGRDVSGSIIGLATSISPEGPWTDWGSIITPEPNAILESPTIAQYGNAYYLFHNRSREGEFYQIGPSPGGPWGSSMALRPGWAHEIWQNLSGEWYTSYLTDYTVTISPLWWDTAFEPAHPTILVDKVYFPLIINIY